VELQRLRGEKLAHREMFRNGARTKAFCRSFLQQPRGDATLAFAAQRRGYGRK
jgi:hypothetical protein